MWHQNITGKQENLTKELISAVERVERHENEWNSPFNVAVMSLEHRFDLIVHLISFIDGLIR